MREFWGLVLGEGAGMREKWEKPGKNGGKIEGKNGENRGEMGEKPGKNGENQGKMGKTREK